MERDTPNTPDSNRISSTGADFVETSRQPISIHPEYITAQLDTLIDWNRTRELVELYRRVHGTPDKILDFSVDKFTSRRLRNSMCASVVRIRMEQEINVLHPSLHEAILRSLSGRNPMVYIQEQFLVISFDMEDKENESIIQASDYGFTLAILLGGLPRIRVGIDENRIREQQLPDETDPM